MASELISFLFFAFLKILKTDNCRIFLFHVILMIQCGQGSTNDQLRPTCIPTLSSIQVESVAAGLWHTVCITANRRVYAFGGNQFGQLGNGADQDEVHNKLTFFLWGYETVDHLIASC